MLPPTTRRSSTSSYDGIQILMIAGGVVIVVAFALIFGM
jgi:hypothetical protein